MKTILTILLLTLSLQVAFAQEQAKTAAASMSGWETVLPAGTLQQRPDIVAVDGGFAVPLASFTYPGWRFQSAWLLFDPVNGSWSDYEFPLLKSPLLEIDDNPVARLDIAGLFPDDPGLKFQLVDGGKKAVFLLHAGEMLFDHSHYDGVAIVNPADRTVERLNLWMCHGPPNSKAIVWEFPEQNLSVSCDLLIWHEGDSYRTETISEYVGQDGDSMLHLISHSLDHRYWILRERYYYDPWYGDYYLYDRHTGLTTVLLWADWGKPQAYLVVWLSSSSLLVNNGHYVLYLDLTSGDRRELLLDEISALPGEGWHREPRLSIDGRWLIVARDDGSLLLRNVFDALRRQG